MFSFNRFAALSAPIAALAALTVPAAGAETMIYVTDTAIGTVDSTTPGTDNTSSNSGSGPLNYVLPNGTSVIGAKVSVENQTLYLLVAGNGVCQLYSVDTSGSDGTAHLSAVNADYACAPPTGTGDFSFVNYSGSSSETDSYLLANGGNILEVSAGGGSTTPIAVSTPGGGAADIWALGDEGSSAADALQTLYGVDAGTQEVFQLTFGAGDQTATETPLASAPVTFSGNASLDYSTSSGTLYLYTANVLYAYGGTPYPNNVSVGAFPILGNMPAGTLAMAVANGASINNNSGAVAPATLLPLLGMALLRRRRASAAVVGQG